VLNIPDLSMGGPQSALIIVFALIVVIIAAIFVTVALNSRGDTDYEKVTKVGYWIRKRWLILLIAVAVIQVSVSTVFLPYSTSAKPDVVVKVSGYQFNWTIDKPRIKAGSVARFDVTSSDVNHGIGIYDPKGELLSSVQAMPGYTNRFELKLKTPGKYVIACLEFCGIGHHKMLSSIDVYRGN
jgi:cytochrome c oxidase subunit 2